MPNWSSNNLTVCAGTAVPNAKEQLKQFVDTVTRAKLADRGIFSQFFPCPEELYAHEASGGFDTWYAWHCNNWGTKWDVDFKDIVEFKFADSGNTLTLIFDTAWSPPTTFVQKVSALYPLLTFTVAYSEGGMGEAGLITYISGEEISHEEIDVAWEEVNPDDEDCHEAIPCEEWDTFMSKYSLHTGG